MTAVVVFRQALSKLAKKIMYSFCLKWKTSKIVHIEAVKLYIYRVKKLSN